MALALTLPAVVVRKFRDPIPGVPLVLGIFLEGVTLLINATFMSPAAIAFLSLSVLISAELLRKSEYIPIAQTAWVAFGIGGWLQIEQREGSVKSVFDSRRAENRWHMGSFLLVILTVYSAVVLYVVESARCQLQRTTNALRQFE